MSAAYYRKVIALVGDVARRGRSGSLRLNASYDTAATLRFVAGQVAEFVPPSSWTQPGRSASEDLSAMRQQILRAAMEAALQAGSSPEFAVPSGSPPSVPARTEAGSLNAADIVIDLCRKLDDMTWLEDPIRGARNARLTTASPAPAVRPHAALGAAEGFLLSRADGSLTVQQVLDTSPLGEADTLRALAALWAVGMLAGPEAKAVAAQSAGAAERAGPEPPRRDGRLSSLDQFLKKTATVTSGSQAPSGASRPGGPRPSGSGTPPPTEQEQERRSLIQKCRDVTDQDHYAALGVERGADEETIRHAYYQLARRYHPDRLLKPHLEDIHRELEGMFAALTEAYNTLSDPAARSEYDREMSDRAGGRRKDSKLDKHAAARDAYLRGRKELEGGRTFEAMRLFESAVESDASRAEYFHYLGLCQGQNPRWRKKAEESLLKAISLNPGAAHSHLELARLYHKGGLERRALEVYEQLLAWDPDNEEALAALGRAPGRGKEGAPAGILRSLFKKD